DVEASADEDRRVLERGVAHRAAVARKVPGGEPPGDLEGADVLGGDLGRRGIALAAGVAAVEWPVHVRCGPDTDRRRPGAGREAQRHDAGPDPTMQLRGQASSPEPAGDYRSAG